MQPLDENQCLVSHLKDLIHICLETKAQGFSMTFNMCNLGSKYPYFNRAYVVSGGFGWTYLYVLISIQIGWSQLYTKQYAKFLVGKQHVFHPTIFPA